MTVARGFSSALIADNAGSRPCWLSRSHLPLVLLVLQESGQPVVRGEHFRSGHRPNSNHPRPPSSAALRARSAGPSSRRIVGRGLLAAVRAPAPAVFGGAANQLRLPRLPRGHPADVGGQRKPGRRQVDRAAKEGARSSLLGGPGAPPPAASPPPIPPGGVPAPRRRRAAKRDAARVPLPHPSPRASRCSSLR